MRSHQASPRTIPSGAQILPMRKSSEMAQLRASNSGWYAAASFCAVAAT